MPESGAAVTQAAQPDNDTFAAAGDRGVTLRSIAFGLCLAVAFSLLANTVLYLVHGSLMAYSHMPMGNLILTMLSMVVCSVLAFRFGRPFVFSRTEWLTVFTMGFVSSLGPTYGVSGYLVGVIVSPYYFATPENRWSEFLHPYLPDFIFPQNRMGEMSWFYNGLPPDTAVPWESWAGPLFWWFTFIAAVAFACFCASIIIHRQWSEYEKLVYPAMEPIVEIASQGGSGKRLLPELMQGRMFWTGFSVSAFIYCWNMIGWFFPAFPNFRMTPGWYLPLARDFPALWISFNTFVICFAYFASLEVLFSLWFFDLFFVVESGILTRLGMPSWHSYRSAGPYTWQTAGAFVCLAVFWVLISRRHLTDAFMKALNPRSEHIDDSRELISYRAAFLGLGIACCYAIAWLWNAGMDTGVIALTIPTMFLVYLAMGKILADSGLVFLSSPTSARSLVQAAFGGPRGIPAATHAIFYPTAVALSHFKGTIFTFGMHANRLGDFVTGNKRRLFWSVCAAFLVGLVASTLYVVWLGYTVGGYNFEPNWLVTRAGHSGFQGAVSDIISPKPMQSSEYVFFIVGVIAMGVITFMRYRFTWWPFHPIGFALSGSALSHLTGFTIFLAWSLKAILLRFFGAAFYRRSRPFFIGLLIGYVFAIALGLVLDAVWFMPQGHRIHVY